MDAFLSPLMFLLNFHPIVLGLLLILTFLACAFTYAINRQIKQEVRKGEEPSLWVLAVKGLWRAATMRQGELYMARGNAHSDTASREYILTHGCRTDASKLEGYMQVCRHDRDGAIPLCFPETLFMKHLLMLAVGKQFRVSPQGLIHIRQTVTVHRDPKELLEAEFSLRASVLEYRSVARGVEVDIGMSVLSSGPATEELWSGVTTVLSRNTQAQHSGQTRTISRDHSQNGQGEGCSSELWVPADTGVQYARVSGDWNPHHLYPWSAKVLGYRAPIAHGMWTLACALAELQAHPDTALGFPVQVQAAFKRPLFMPGQAVVSYDQPAGAQAYCFQVVDKKTNAPHVVGSMQCTERG